MKSLHILLTLAILFAGANTSMGQLFRRHRSAGWSGTDVSVSRSQRLGRNDAGAATPQESQLIQIIRKQQALHVGDSWGEQDWQCFDWSDWQQFVVNNIPRQVTAYLSQDAHFQKLVAEIQELDAGQRQRMLARAGRTYRPTWAQLGRISTEGQTEAGQLAERRIAQAIVELLERKPARTER